MSFVQWCLFYSIFAVQPQDCERVLGKECVPIFCFSDATFRRVPYHIVEVVLWERLVLRPVLFRRVDDCVFEGFLSFEGLRSLQGVNPRVVEARVGSQRVMCTGREWGGAGSCHVR